MSIFHFFSTSKLFSEFTFHFIVNFYFFFFLAEAFSLYSMNERTCHARCEMMLGASNERSQNLRMMHLVSILACYPYPPMVFLFLVLFLLLVRWITLHLKAKQKRYDNFQEGFVGYQESHPSIQSHHQLWMCCSCCIVDNFS